jgi:hypothetical protein
MCDLGWWEHATGRNGHSPHQRPKNTPWASR